jgi:RHS repeat-associated protein
MTQAQPINEVNPTWQRTLLLAVDLKNSVLVELDAGNPNRVAYSPYGQQSAELEVKTRLGFNGELRELKPEWYWLGKGYRVYNPQLMRFHSPDSLSPFHQGGLNSYTYCGGEPLMNKDPTGHNFFAVLQKAMSHYVATYQTQRAAGQNPVTALISSVKPNVGLPEILGASNLSARPFVAPAITPRPLLSAKEGGLHLKVGGVPSSTPSSESTASLPGSSGRGPGEGYKRGYQDDSWHDSRAKKDAEKKPNIVTRYPESTNRTLSPASQTRVKDVRK